MSTDKNINASAIKAQFARNASLIEEEKLDRVRKKEAEADAAVAEFKASADQFANQLSLERILNACEKQRATSYVEIDLPQYLRDQFTKLRYIHGRMKDADLTSAMIEVSSLLKQRLQELAKDFDVTLGLFEEWYDEYDFDRRYIGQEKREWYACRITPKA